VPVHTQTAVQAAGNLGSIKITVSNTGSGAEDIDVDVLASIANAQFSFTGATPTESSTFGDNGARWNGYSVLVGREVEFSYGYSNGGSSSGPYTIVVRKTGTDIVLSQASGTIPSPSPA
jgi:hypothetical protein